MKYLEGLEKLVIANYRLGEMSGEFGETGYSQLDLGKCMEGLVKLVIASNIL